MTSYIAAIKTDSEAFKYVSPCFCTPLAKLTEFKGTWVLSSTDFIKCNTGQEVFPVADAIVANIKKLVNLYSGLKIEATVDHILWLNEHGDPYKKSIRSTTDINVFSQLGIQMLATIKDSSPLGSEILAKTQSTKALDQMLILLPEGELGWFEIYEVIEFLGNARGIAKAKLASEKSARRVGQTANHYRHLGATKNNPLPINPPTINEARTFTRDLIMKWIDSKI